MTSDTPDWAPLVRAWVKPEDWKKVDEWEYINMVERPDWRAEVKLYTLAVKESPNGQLTVSRCDEVCACISVADQVSDLPRIFCDVYPPSPPEWAHLVSEWVDPEEWYSWADATWCEPQVWHNDQWTVKCLEGHHLWSVTCLEGYHHWDRMKLAKAGTLKRYGVTLCSSCDVEGYYRQAATSTNLPDTFRRMQRSLLSLWSQND